VLAIIDADLAEKNVKAYREYRHTQHLLKLQGASHLRVPKPTVAEHAAAVMLLWHQVFAD